MLAVRLGSASAPLIDPPTRKQKTTMKNLSQLHLAALAAGVILPMWTLVPAQAIAGKFIASFKDYPPSQRVVAHPHPKDTLLLNV
jgi:hypothetical protein